jgi:hypothetical protein
MNTKFQGTKLRLKLFVVFTFVIGWILFLLIPVLGIPYGQIGSMLFAMAAMFAPTAGNILTRLVTKEGFRDMYLRRALRETGSTTRWLSLALPLCC